MEAYHRVHAPWATLNQRHKWSEKRSETKATQSIPHPALLFSFRGAHTHPSRNCPICARTLRPPDKPADFGLQNPRRPHCRARSCEAKDNRTAPALPRQRSPPHRSIASLTLNCRKPPSWARPLGWNTSLRRLGTSIRPIGTFPIAQMPCALAMRPLHMPKNMPKEWELEKPGATET